MSTLSSSHSWRARGGSCTRCGARTQGPGPCLACGDDNLRDTVVETAVITDTDHGGQLEVTSTTGHTWSRRLTAEQVHRIRRYGTGLEGGDGQ